MDPSSNTQSSLSEDWRQSVLLATKGAFRCETYFAIGPKKKKQTLEGRSALLSKTHKNNSEFPVLITRTANPELGEYIITERCIEQCEYSKRILARTYEHVQSHAG